MREYIKTSKRIRFEGDGYGVEWQEEARRRKLSYNKNTPEALQVITSKQSLELFKQMDVMNEVELKAHKEVELGAYIFHIQIEGRVLGEMVYACITWQDLRVKMRAYPFSHLGENGMPAPICKTCMPINGRTPYSGSGKRGAPAQFCKTCM